MSDHSNPPAFPRDERFLGHDGMDLRDWFAGQVLPAVLTMAVQSIAAGIFKSSSGGDLDEADFAKQAYAFADAMLAARSEPTS